MSFLTALTHKIGRRSRVTARPGISVGGIRAYANLGRDGVSSVGIKIGPAVYNIPVSENARSRHPSGISSIDLPGPISYRPAREKQRTVAHKTGPLDTPPQW